MAHVRSNKRQLIARIRRIQGQLEAVIRGIESDEDCFRVLQTAAACRGAFTGLLLGLLDDHIQTHLADSKDLSAVKKEAANLKTILGSYLK